MELETANIMAKLMRMGCAFELAPGGVRVRPEHPNANIEIEVRDFAIVQQFSEDIQQALLRSRQFGTTFYPIEFQGGPHDGALAVLELSGDPMDRDGDALSEDVPNGASYILDIESKAALWAPQRSNTCDSSDSSLWIP